MMDGDFTGSIVIINDGKRSFAPKFSDCLLDLLEKNTIRVEVTAKSYNGNILIESSATRDSFLASNRTNLQHSPKCPLRSMGTLQQEVKIDNCDEKNIRVAVSVILESSDCCILLTKRPKHMRSSPGVWVPPGGHLEKNETLLECGLREVLEETGLSLEGDVKEAQLLCAWENVYPLIIELGAPKHHSVVFYYHIRTYSSHIQLIDKMDIDPVEVAAYTWLPPHVLLELFLPTPTETYTQYQYVFEDGKVIKKKLKYLDIFNRFIWTSTDVYSGVQCSLLEWRKMYKNRENKCKF